MFVHCPNDWLDFIVDINDREDLNKLSDQIQKHYEKDQCFPPMSLLFNAFTYCQLQQLKVVVLGQDPYHGLGQAHGLAFSVPFGVKHPPSLKNIIVEWSRDLDLSYPFSGNLEPWAAQGVLLLNTALSVGMSKPGSHLKDWRSFTETLISGISSKKDFVIFVLWGGFAQKFEKYINTDKHLVLKAGHPSPLSANKGHWFGNKHFSKINEVLESKKIQPIDWSLE